ncbi:hypothetical protein RHGRI_010233 [Rhododendron griersonianum]|uniref:Uncharacterized protein n=1 Tax=Rhododendron griersonianum TaxID=479676 RepID=A0AAV6KIF3_9ERIC|nr:hypothetical protein RHGRI_010233 [Rhododendron griersonianum]
MIVKATKGNVVRLEPLWNIGLAATNTGTICTSHVRTVGAYGPTCTNEDPCILTISQEFAKVIAADDRQLIRSVRKCVWPAGPESLVTAPVLL